MIEIGPLGRTKKCHCMRSNGIYNPDHCCPVKVVTQRIVW
jgi:hypothetical protein